MTIIIRSANDARFFSIGVGEGGFRSRYLFLDDSMLLFILRMVSRLEVAETAETNEK